MEREREMEGERERERVMESERARDGERGARQRLSRMKERVRKKA